MQYAWEVEVHLDNNHVFTSAAQVMSVYPGATEDDAREHAHKQMVDDLARCRQTNAHWSLGPVRERPGHLAVHPDRVIMIATSVWPVVTQVPPAETPAGDEVTQLLPVVDGEAT